MPSSTGCGSHQTGPGCPRRIRQQWVLKELPDLRNCPRVRVRVLRVLGPLCLDLIFVSLGTFLIA